MTTETTTETYTVTGMTCSHCVSSVSEEVRELPGVTDVAVDLSTGQVTITAAAPVGADKVRGAVEEAGYQLADTT